MADQHHRMINQATPNRLRDTASSLLASFFPTRTASSPTQKSPVGGNAYALSRAYTSSNDAINSQLNGSLGTTEVAQSASCSSNFDISNRSTPPRSPELDSRSLHHDQPRTPSPQFASASRLDFPLPDLPQTLLTSSASSQSFSTPRVDSRSLSGRSLRARQSLSLSTKAQANIERGIKDPRNFQSPTPKSSKPSKSQNQRSSLEQTARQILKEHHDVFVLEYRKFFVPLLPPESNYIQRIVDMISTSQGSQETLLLRSPKNYVKITEQPKGIKGTLQKHQMEGLSFLVWLQANGVNGILGDEMGLGKTIQTLSLLQHNKERIQDHVNYKPSIVVCPLAVLQTWQLQARNFTPGLSTMIFNAPITHRQSMRSKLRRAMNAKAVDIVIVSYETYERELLALRLYKWSHAILDEGHKMKNADSQVAKALQSIAADHRLILTGTPIQNDLFELWSLFHWLLPKMFDTTTRNLFEDSFILSKHGGVNVATIANARGLLELLMLRRTKEDCQADMKLPPVTETVLSIPLTALQRDTYRACVTSTSKDTMSSAIRYQANMASSLEPDEKSSPNTDNPRHYRELLNLLMQLRKVSIHPYLLPGVQPDPYEIGAHVYETSGKFLVLKVLLQKLMVEEGKKIIIFSGFKGALDCVEDLLKTLVGHSPKFLRIDGDGSRAYRNLSVRLFQEDATYTVMLATLRAGGFGITLTAAQVVIFLDQDWNPQVTVQAAARAHRIGQTKPVTILKLVSSGTVEVQMERRIAKKLYLSAKVTDSFKHANSEAHDEEEIDTIAADGSSSMPKFSFGQLASIIGSSRESVSDPSAALHDMLGWSFEEIMSHCAKTRTSAEIDGEDEQAWLQERERTQTAMFEGRIHQRQKKLRISQDDDDVFNSPREARRVGKETTVLIDGFAVSKSNLTCSEWEAGSTLTSKEASLCKRPRTKHQEFSHLKTCTICHQLKQEELLKCNDCPKTYHQSCASTSGIFSSIHLHVRQCPAHKCCKCMQSATNCGGLLFQCTNCPRAYCEEDVEWDLCERVGFELQQFTDLGFVNQRKAYYVKCKLCSGKSSASVEKKILNDRILAPTDKTIPVIDLDAEDSHVNASGGKRKRDGMTTRSTRNTGVTAREPILIDSD